MRNRGRCPRKEKANCKQQKVLLQRRNRDSCYRRDSRDRRVSGVFFFFSSSGINIDLGLKALVYALTHKPFILSLSRYNSIVSKLEEPAKGEFQNYNANNLMVEQLKLEVDGLGSFDCLSNLLE